MSLKAVIFDVDGVITDTVPLHYSAWERMFTEYGYHFDENIYKEKVNGRPRIDSIKDIMNDLSEEIHLKAAEIKQNYFIQMIEDGHLNTFESSVRFIKGLSSENILIAAASSSKNARFVLEKIGIIDYFDVVVCGNDIKNGKPHPEIFLTATEKLNINVNEALVIEDAQSGIRAAKCGGFFCIGIDRHNNQEFFTEADYVINDLEELDFNSVQKLFESKFTMRNMRKKPYSSYFSINNQYLFRGR